MNKKNKRTNRKKRVTCIVVAAVLAGTLTLPVWADEPEVCKSSNMSTRYQKSPHSSGD